jgi:hypothetical protein
MTWNNPPQQKKEPKDSFWMGFIPSFILPILTSVIYFELRYETSKPLFSALYEFISLGRMSKNDMLTCLLPSLILLAIFSVVKKEKAMLGTFVGFTPFVILFFWMI